VSLSCRIRQCLCSSTNRFEHVFFINKQFRTCANDFPNEFTVRSYDYCVGQHWNFTQCKKTKQRRISFVLGYLLMILWKISTAISIKHRILATSNKTKSILTAFELSFSHRSPTLSVADPFAAADVYIIILTTPPPPHPPFAAADVHIIF
jgi:hypothetical protein